MARYIDADARILRAAAHPIRHDIAYELFARGAGTATELASAIGQPVNSVSFHLRQLAAVGLVEEAPRRSSDGRQRWWKMTASEGLRVRSERVRAEPGGEVTLRIRRRHASAWWTAVVQRFFGDDHIKDPRVWVSRDVPMRLTDGEAAECAQELYEVLQRWTTRGQAAEASDSPSDNARRTYLALALVFPRTDEG